VPSIKKRKEKHDKQFVVIDICRCRYFPVKAVGEKTRRQSGENFPTFQMPRARSNG